MKVLFLYQDKRMPSSRIRILDLLPEIRKEGIFASEEEYPRKYSEKLDLFRKLKGFDIVYLQKKLPAPIEARLLRRCAGRLIFDFDDAIYYRDDSAASLISRSRYLKFRYLAGNSDFLVAGNRILADYARQFNRNVAIIPSAVETRSIVLKDHNRPDGPVVIGWIGGGGNLRHLETISDVLARLAERYRFQLNIVSNAGMEIRGVQTKAVPWTLAGQSEEVARFDIGVMPLPVNKWTEGKCGYKALQYMAAGVPPVVSDVGVNCEIVGDGREGLVVSGEKGFYDALATLITDKDLRRKLGNNAHRKVEQAFSVRVVGKKLADILKAIMAMKPHGTDTGDLPDLTQL